MWHKAFSAARGVHGANQSGHFSGANHGVLLENTMGNYVAIDNVSLGTRGTVAAAPLLPRRWVASSAWSSRVQSRCAAFCAGSLSPRMASRACSHPSGA